MNRVLMTASMLLMSVLMLVSCDKKVADETIDMDAGFAVSFDKNVIQSNGEDVVTFTARLDGTDVTAQTEFYIVTIKDKKEVFTPISGNTFTTSDEGEYSFKAAFGTFYLEEAVKLTAIDMAIPSAAADSAPSNTSFVHRSFLTQYTGTGCGYCPGMIRALREAFKDEETKNMAVHAAVHSYAAGDPAYITGPRATSYPYLEIDMSAGFTYNMDPDAKAGVLKAALRERTSAPAKVGISANPHFENDYLVVTVSVKAAEDGNYRLGVWFLQDDVYGIQKDELGITDSSYNKHENCVRQADSRYLNNYAGYPLPYMKKGETIERTFVLKVLKDIWKLKDEDMSDIHFVAFVTEKVQRGFNVLNVVDCKYDEPTPFEYKN